MKNLLQRKNENRNSKETTKEPRKEFQQVGVDNRKTETNRNDESPTFDEEREYRKVTENMRILSISSRPILSANFHVPTFIMCQFLSPCLIQQTGAF